jgi:hypothetical protein
MTARLAIWFAALALAAHPLVAAESKDAKHRNLSSQERMTFFRTAQVWTPTRVGEMDIRTGPIRKDGFKPDQVVNCEFSPSKKTGTSKKFNCTLPDGDVVKVRYGADNGEVEGTVLATRLLWALGFGADAAYPVRVICHGCSDDPWTKRETTHGTFEFPIATIELKPQGHEMHGDKDGWSWAELSFVDDTQGGAPRHQRDALKLLAVFMQHTDNKAVQQRLQCLPGGLDDDGSCSKPFLVVHDVGLTFGHANYLNRNNTSSVNFEEWSKTPVWRDKEKCIGHLSKSSTGTLGDPKISEEGRAFLAGLLDQLTDAQLRDLFSAGHVERRSRRPGSSDAPATIDEWVNAFKAKRADIDGAHCASN